jgi:predicted nucleotidyltransferase
MHPPNCTGEFSFMRANVILFKYHFFNEDGLCMDLIVKMKFGSYLYGTSTSKSDVDYKGVFLPSKNEVLLGRIPKCHNYSSSNCKAKNTPHDTDVEIYSLNYFINLACEGQTVALDMLHAPDSVIEVSSEIWRTIVDERDRFYTKNLKSFINYARRQASKYGIKGSRLNAVSHVLNVLKASVSTQKLRSVWDKLPQMEHCYVAETDPNGMRQYQVCGKLFQESAEIGYVIPILEKFHDDYGARAKQAAENKNIDWKAISHALRAAFQVKEIFTQRTITFPLKEAAFLVKVKEGKLDYLNEVVPVLEGLMTEVEELASGSNLPEKVDTAYWERFICDTLERELFGKYGKKNI